jgi:hypothetical protein
MPPPDDARATSARGTENRGVDERAAQDLNQQLLEEVGLSPGKKGTGATTALSFEDWARGARPILKISEPEPLPTITEEQRKLAERKRTESVKPPRTEKEQFERAAVEAGTPVKMFQRPLTDFEVRLQTQKKVQLLHPGTGQRTTNFLSTDFTPIADPATGTVIGYAKSGADLLICDLDGNVQHWRDAPITPSAIQPDDLILVGGALVKVGAKLAAKGGAALVGSGLRRVPSRILMRLRTTAAALMIGTSKAAPTLAGEPAAKAVIAVERAGAAEVAEGFGSRALARGTESRLAGAAGEAAPRAVTRGTEARLAAAASEGAPQAIIRAPATGAGVATAGRAAGRQSARSTARAASEQGLISPAEGRLGFQSHATSPSVRRELQLSGAESAHIVPQAVGARIANYSPGRALTSLLPRAAHLEFDRGWVPLWNQAIRSGQRITAGDVHRWLYNAIEGISEEQLSPRSKGTLQWRLFEELYRELGLTPESEIVPPRL